MLSYQAPIWSYGELLADGLATLPKTSFTSATSLCLLRTLSSFPFQQKQQRIRAVGLHFERLPGVVLVGEDFMRSDIPCRRQNPAPGFSCMEHQPVSMPSHIINCGETPLSTFQFSPPTTLFLTDAEGSFYKGFMGSRTKGPGACLLIRFRRVRTRFS